MSRIYIGAGSMLWRRRRCISERMGPLGSSVGVIQTLIVLALFLGGFPLFASATRGPGQHNRASNRRFKDSKDDVVHHAVGFISEDDAEEVLVSEEEDDWQEDEWSEDVDWPDRAIRSGKEALALGSIQGKGRMWGSRDRTIRFIPKRGSSRWIYVGSKKRINRLRQQANSVYREVKGALSSEMEGLVLKATRPDNGPVKQKHLVALMQPAAITPEGFNVYLPLVRKLWVKMTDKEWRVTAKALHIVHCFAALGNPAHAENLKRTVSVLRTQQDSRRQAKFFDMDLITEAKPAPWATEDVAPFARFLEVYAQYVLQRATRFGSDFKELTNSHAMMLGKAQLLDEVAEMQSAGLRCVLSKEQEAAVTVASVFQVARDLRELTDICAAQLELLIAGGDAANIYAAEVDRWYEFLSLANTKVEGYIHWVNTLATRHKMSPVQPLMVAPAVLRRKDSILGRLRLPEAKESPPSDSPGGNQQNRNLSSGIDPTDGEVVESISGSVPAEPPVEPLAESIPGASTDTTLSTSSGGQAETGISGDRGKGDDEAENQEGGVESSTGTAGEGDGCRTRGHSRSYTTHGGTLTEGTQAADRARQHQCTKQSKSARELGVCRREKAKDGEELESRGIPQGESGRRIGSRLKRAASVGEYSTSKMSAGPCPFPENEQ